MEIWKKVCKYISNILSKDKYFSQKININGIEFEFRDLINNISITEMKEKFGECKDIGSGVYVYQYNLDKDRHLRFIFMKQVHMIHLP